LRREGDVAAAGRAHLEELALAERVYGAEHAEYAMALYGTAHHEYSVGNLDEAWRIWEQCRDVLERALGPRAKRLGSTYYSFACLAAIQERRDVALEMLGRALDCDGWVWRGILEDSDLDSLRGDPEFEALMDEVRRRVEKRAAVLAAVAQ
jgi:tetratricopeptide (TPR) repeat protein